MKKTLDKLVKLDIEDENALANFFRQLNLDFKKNIAHDKALMQI